MGVGWRLVLHVKTIGLNVPIYDFIKLKIRAGLAANTLIHRNYSLLLIEFKLYSIVWREEIKNTNNNIM